MKNENVTGENFTDDVELVSQIHLGRHEVFEQIVRKYQSKIIGFCRHMLSDQGLAEDAAQETFIKAWQSIHDYTPSSSFSAWLFRIARNHCIDVLRVSKNNACELKPDDVSVSPRAASSVEARDLLQKLMCLLSMNAREVLLLREIYGMSYEEMANSLGCSTDAVRSRLKRARVDVMGHMRHFLPPVNVVIDKGKK